jgi:dihydroorotate dehydrogenase
MTSAGRSNAGLVISSGKRELIFSSPLMNSAGFLGFGSEARKLLDPDMLGAFVTAPVSLQPRTPARGPRAAELPGSFLLHTGLPNPGLRSVLAREAPFWSQLKTALILHLLVDHPQDLVDAGRLLDDFKRIDGIELGLEILPPGQAAALIEQALRIQLPLIVRLPLDCPLEVFLTVEAAGAHALALGPPRGRAARSDGRSISGRMYGPALLPLLLEKLSRLRSLIACPLIAGAGLFSPPDLQLALQNGADALQLDSVLWTHPEIINSFEPGAGHSS